MERDVAMMAEEYEKISLESELLYKKQDELKEHHIALEQLLQSKHYQDLAMQNKLNALQEINLERVLKNKSMLNDQLFCFHSIATDHLYHQITWSEVGAINVELI